MAKEEKKMQVNAGEMETELVEKLDLMCVEDENNRSQFIRKLIRQEWARRHQPALPSLEMETGKAKSKRQQAVAA